MREISEGIFGDAWFVNATSKAEAVRILKGKFPDGADLVGKWTGGTVPVNTGSSLQRFVVREKRPAKSAFDIDVALEERRNR